VKSEDHVSLRIFHERTAISYDEVRNDDLENLRLQARPASESLLQERDHNMTERCADERAVHGHLRHAASEVVSRLVAVFCDPRGQELLQSRKRARCEHLGLERVLLELLQVPLSHLTCQLRASCVVRASAARSNALQWHIAYILTAR
jgi:hypothetical protein